MIIILVIHGFYAMHIFSLTSKTGAWSKSLVDTDKELDFLYNKCASAGSACPLHANSSALVKQRVDSIFAKIKAAPVAVVHGADYGLVDYRILKTELFMSLYHPYTMFLPFAQALASLENGDGHPALAIWKKVLPMPKCDTSRPPAVGEWKEAMLAVMCGEAKDVRNSLPDIVDHLRDQYKISIFADNWTDSMRTSCA